MVSASGQSAPAHWYEQANEAILRNTPPLAERIMALHFERNPKLEQTYDERQRNHYLEDTRSTLGALSAALLLETPQMFSDYVDWLVSLLKARNIPTGGLPLHFECMRVALKEVMPDDLWEKVSGYLEAGAKELSGT